MRIDLTTNQAIDTPGPTPPTKQPRDADTESSEDRGVIFWVDLEDRDLHAWEADRGRLCEQWRKHSEEFNKKDPQWHGKAKPHGCVRPVLWDSKCYLTINAKA
jgi:hypothetical protein